MKIGRSYLFRLVTLSAMFMAAGMLVPMQSAFAQEPGSQPAIQADASSAEIAEAIEADEAPEPKLLDDEQRKGLDDVWAIIVENNSIANGLEDRIPSYDGLMREILETRLDSLITIMLEEAMRFARQLADLSDDGYDISDYSEQLTIVLKELPPRIRETADRIGERVIMPDFSKSAAEQAAIDQQFFAAVRAYNKTNKALIETAEIQARFGMDASELLQHIRDNLANGTANTSIFLDLSVAQASDLQAGVLALPDDAELKAQLKVAEDRVLKVAAILESDIAVSADMGLSVAEYKQQLLTSTGNITASSLDLEVVTGLLRDWGNDLADGLVEQGPGFLFQLLLFVVIIYIFKKLAGLVQRGVDSALEANKRHLSHLLRQMISSVSKNIVIILGVLIALSQVGLSLGPLLTGLGIAGFIVGFALQDSLSNFASGLMILFYRPFDVGDTIEAGGVSGQVSSMSLVNTTIRTFDNKSLIIPNNKIWQDVITNVTDQTQRRVDMTFGIAYDEDIDRVEKLLLEIVQADDRVLENPEPVVKVGSFGDSSVNLLCRPWVRTADYWSVLWDLNKKVKQAFDKEGIVIPFPQRDVHMYHEQSPEPKSSSDPAGNQ